MSLARALAVLTLLAVPALGAGARDTGARFSRVEGDVVARRQSREWVPVRTGQAVDERDEVLTGPDSRATLEFSGGATVTLKELSQVSIGRLLTAAGRAEVQVLLKLGEVSAEVKPQRAVKTDFSIKSPTVTASVRGTEFKRVSYHPARGTEVTLLRGRVRIDSARGSIETGADEPSITDAGGRITGPRELAAEASRIHVEPVGLTASEVRQITATNQPQITPPALNGPSTSSSSPNLGASLIFRYQLQ